MTLSLTGSPPSGRWTTHDLERFPEDNRRRELLDGALILPAAPTAGHQIVAMRLLAALEPTCPEALHVTHGMQIRFSDVTAVIGDGVVTTWAAAAPNPRWYRPEDVVLVVEVVSDTSVTMDRLVKPALYAAAGIPFFWRIETRDGLAVHAYKLDPTEQVYRVVGEFTETIAVSEPWEISVPIERLRPRHL